MKGNGTSVSVSDLCKSHLHCSAAPGPLPSPPEYVLVSVDSGEHWRGQGTLPH